MKGVKSWTREVVDNTCIVMVVVMASVGRRPQQSVSTGDNDSAPAFLGTNVTILQEFQSAF